MAAFLVGDTDYNSDTGSLEVWGSVDETGEGVCEGEGLLHGLCRNNNLPNYTDHLIGGFCSETGYSFVADGELEVNLTIG